MTIPAENVIEDGTGVLDHKGQLRNVSPRKPTKVGIRGVYEEGRVNHNPAMDSTPGTTALTGAVMGDWLPKDLTEDGIHEEFISTSAGASSFKRRFK